MRFPDAPALGPRLGRRFFVSVTTWHARIDPGHQHLLVALGHLAFVYEYTVKVRVRVPGRHAVVLEHGVDHRRPSAHLFIGSQRKRRDLLESMAFLTIVLDDPGDVRRVCYRLLGIDFRDPRNQTARSHRAGDERRPSLQHVLDSRFKVLVLRARPLRSDGVLIVDHASVANDALFVYHEGYRGRLGVKLTGQDLVPVFQDGKRHTEFLDLFGNLVQVIVRVGIDAHKANALPPVLRAERLQPRGVTPGDRATQTRIGHDQDLIGVEIQQVNLLASQVKKGHVRQLLADAVLR